LEPAVGEPIGEIVPLEVDADECRVGERCSVDRVQASVFRTVPDGRTPRRTVGAVIMVTAVLRMVLANDNFLVREGVAALLG
jgi:hypothetical protein